MGIAPIAAIGPAIVPAMPVYAAPINPLSATAAGRRRPSGSGAGQRRRARTTWSRDRPSAGATGATRLEQDLMKAALLIGLLDDDDDKKDNPVLDLIVAAAVLKMYEQMSAMGATSGVGFVGDGAGGAIGLSRQRDGLTRAPSHGSSPVRGPTG